MPTTLPGTGTVVATDDIAGVAHQLVKVEFGAAGVATPVSAANPLPVTNGLVQALTDAQLRATAVPVSGAFFQATQPVSIAAMPTTPVTFTWAGLTDTQLRATAVPVSFTWAGLTDAQLRATPVPVSGTVAVTGTFWQATQPVSGSVSVSNFPATQPVSGTFWQATQPVSIASMPSTPVTGTFWQATQPVSLATGVAQGTAAATASAWPVKITDGTSVAAVKAASTAAATTDPAQVVAMHPLSPAYFKASDVVGTVLSAANTAATLTVVAGGAGLFLYITRIRVTMHNTSAAAVAATATALAFTTTNIPGSLAWTEGNALAAGTSKTVVDEYLDSPIKTSVAATATTIVCPACGAGVQARATLYGYYAP